MIESYNVVYHLHLPLDQIQEVVRAAIPNVSTSCATSSANGGVTSIANCGVTNGSANSSTPPPTTLGGGGGDGVLVGTKNGAISIEALLNVLSANLELNHVESSVLAPTTITV